MHCLILLAYVTTQPHVAEADTGHDEANREIRECTGIQTLLAEAAG